MARCREHGLGAPGSGEVERLKLVFGVSAYRAFRADQLTSPVDLGGGLYLVSPPMKLRRLAYLGALLTPVLLGCSDDATVLSVNINLSSDKLDRSNPAAWSAIQVSVAGKPLPTPIAIQTEQVTVEGMAEKATR